MRIRGRPVTPSGAGLPAGAWVRVRLLDVSRADAAAEVLAEGVVVVPARIPETPAPAPAPVEVELDVDPTALTDRGSHTLTAHVDLDGSGEVARGDLVSTGHIGIGPQDEGRVVLLPLERVP